MNDNERKHAFISYDHDLGIDYLDGVINEIERNTNFIVETDRDLIPGESWSNQIFVKIKDADVLVVIVTDYDSREIENEIGYAQTYGVPVIPLYTDEYHANEQLKKYYIDDLHGLYIYDFEPQNLDVFAEEDDSSDESNQE